MTLAATGQCDAITARKLTDELRQSLTIAADLLIEVYERRAWAALGYHTWADYTTAELGEVRLRLPREDRREVVATMTQAGMSTRAIGSALGVAQDTVRRDQGERFRSPEPIDAEVIHDDLGDRIARELAASDGQYAEQAAPARPVLGTDGKTYPAPKPPAPRRRPLPDAFRDAAYDLTKVTERIARLADDDRFPSNAEQVAARNRNDLIRAIDALQGVVNRLPSA